MTLTYMYILGIFVCQSGQTDQSVHKQNARVLRTILGKTEAAHGSEPLSSPSPISQSAGIWRVVTGKMYTCASDLSI